MKITFIGGGNMANAIITGLLNKGFSDDQIGIVEADAEKRKTLSVRFRCEDPANTYKLIDADTVVVLAVKPQQAKEVLEQLGMEKDGNLMISIMAGIKLSTISRHRAGYMRVVRAMPNTPALIGAGITGYYTHPATISNAVSAEDLRRTEQILGAIGSTVRVNAEDELDAVTAVSGSGPAYVFYFIEALRNAGIELGLASDVANKLALETFLGAAQLAAQSHDDVAILRERVTSKGGTTAAALASMTEDHVKEAVIRAVKAAQLRSVQLGNELGN